MRGPTQLPPDGARNMSARMTVGSTNYDVSVPIHYLTQEGSLYYFALGFANRPSVEHADFAADIVKLVR